MRAKLDVSGLQDYANKLVKAGADIDAAADQALTDAAQILYASILPRIPVDTGNLRDHLVINGPIRSDNRHYVYVEIDLQDREQMLYAVYQEFGTARHPARSYIRTGVQSAKSRASKAMQTAFEKYLASL